MSERIKELRVQRYTTFNTTHLNPATGGSWDCSNVDSGWSASSRPSTCYTAKLSVTAVDAAGLDHLAIENAELQSKPGSTPAPVKGPKQGNLKFSMYAGKASASVVPPIQAKILEMVMGGLTSTDDEDRAILVTGTSQTYSITATTTYLKVTPGQAILVGVRGDGAGEGQVRIARASASNVIEPNIQLSGAPAANAQIAIAHTVFFDDTPDQQYLDWVLIGNQEGDDMQGLASIGPCNITGLGIGEVPTLEFDFTVGDWQWTDQSVDGDIATGTATNGDTAPSIHEGMFLLTDYDSSAVGPGNRTYNAAQLKSCGDVSVSLGIEYAQVPGFNGKNGIDKFKKIRCKPVITCNVLIEDALDVATTYDDLYADYVAGTAKSVILQIGHTINNCLAFTMDKCYISACPKYTSMNGLQAVSIQLTGTTTGGATDILDTPIAIHWI